MRAFLTVFGRLLPPAFVLFLFADLMMNPDIPRLGVSGATGQTSGLTLDESRELLRLSRKLISEGKHTEALAPALKLYSAYPGNNIYIQTLAQIYHRLENYKEEAEYWEKFLQYAPLPVEGCPQIGQAYWKQKRTKEAISAFERCLSFEPDNFDSIFFLAHALELTGDLKRAETLYRQGIPLGTNSSDCKIGLARVQAHQGRVAESKKCILEVLSKSPDDVDALLVRAILYWREGDLAQAKAFLLKGLKLSERYADYYLVLGRIEESQGHISQAVMRYDRVLELDPDNRDAARRRRALTGRR